MYNSVYNPTSRNTQVCKSDSEEIFGVKEEIFETSTPEFQNNVRKRKLFKENCWKYSLDLSRN